MVNIQNFSSLNNTIKKSVPLPGAHAGIEYIRIIPWFSITAGTTDYLQHEAIL